MSILDDFSRVNRARPCPVCGKGRWCLVSRDDPHSPSQVICQRTESNFRWGEAGWLHTLRPDDVRPRDNHARVIQAPRKPAQDFDALAAEFEHEADGEMIDGLTASLGVTSNSLRRLHTGWASARKLDRLDTDCRGRGCWTFPMRDAAGAIVGIRLRSEGGFKYSVKGAASGLFIAQGLKGDGPLLVTEGPTDAAALLDFGFDAIGRPSCGGGSRLLVDFLKGHRRSSVAILSDNDGPGRRGAHSLASRISPHCGSCCVVSPPDGVNDAREWKAAGATRETMLEVIETADPYRLNVVSGNRVAHA